jgi:hypothetical protein
MVAPCGSVMWLSSSGHAHKGHSRLVHVQDSIITWHYRFQQPVQCDRGDGRQIWLHWLSWEHCNVERVFDFGLYLVLSRSVRVDFGNSSGKRSSTPGLELEWATMMGGPAFGPARQQTTAGHIYLRPEPKAVGRLVWAIRQQASSSASVTFSMWWPKCPDPGAMALAFWAGCDTITRRALYVWP